MKSTGTLIALIIAMAVAGGCKKDETNTIAPTSTAPAGNPLQQVFENNLADATQHFTVNAGAENMQVQGAQGTLAYFGPHSFLHADGSVVSGAVDIDLVEALKLGDMLWLNKQTLADDAGQMRLLVSGGQFRLRAFQAGVALKLAPGASVILVPTTTPPDPLMNVFSGNVNEVGTMTWTAWPTNPIVPIESLGLDTIPETSPFWYGFPTDSLNWINCDHYYGSAAPLTAVEVTCPDAYSYDNTMVWVLVPSETSFVRLGALPDHVFGTGGVYELPIGLSVVVVALSDIGGTYYSSFTNTTVTQDLNLPITLQPTTLAQFHATAQAL